MAEHAPVDGTAALVAALQAGDAADLRDVLGRHPGLKARLNEPMPGLAFDSLPLHAAVPWRKPELIDVLLQAGADINARSRWWAGSFGVLDTADASLVPFLLERGARVDAHSASRLDMLETLKDLVAADPSLVHARGGDGQTPLHFASSVPIAEYLLDRGAVIDARDIDHESTPAQYMVRERQQVARFLVERGAYTDILMAAALGDLVRVRRILDAEPDAIRTTVSERYFPRQNPKSGGTIYIWTLGQHKSPHVVAREFGHEDAFALLMERSPAELKLAMACELGDEAVFQSMLAARLNLVAAMSADERRRVVDAAQNNNTDAVRLMLTAGWPVDTTGQHGATALHWAAFHGNAAMAREILRHAPPLDAKDSDHGLPPLGWALYGSEHGWNCRTGDYTGTVEALLDAGAGAPPLTPDLEASPAVRDVLRRRATG